MAVSALRTLWTSFFPLVVRLTKVRRRSFGHSFDLMKDRALSSLIQTITSGCDCFNSLASSVMPRGPCSSRASSVEMVRGGDVTPTVGYQAAAP